MKWLLVMTFAACTGEASPRSQHDGSQPIDANEMSDGGANEGDGAVASSDGASSSDDGGAPMPLITSADDWLKQVIYLVIPDRFENGDASNDDAVAGCFDPGDPKKIHGGDFAGLKARIPYLQDLGVTALWITPAYLQSVDRCGYHGYWADFADPDDGAIAPNLGNVVDLAALSNALHAEGIRLILDMVVNHSGITARVVSQHPDWFHDPSACASLGSSDVYCPVGGQPLPDFAQENGVVATYLANMSVGWSERFGLDGVRMDTVKNVLPSYWASTWFPAMRAASPGLFVVGEDFDESNASALVPYLNDGFDSLFDYPRYATIVSTFAQGGTVDALADAVQDAITHYGMTRTLHMTSFVDNHDNPRLLSQMPGSLTAAESVAQFRLALGAIFTLPGIPQLIWGDEIAMLGAADPDNRRDMPSWAWTPATRVGSHLGTSVGDGQVSYGYTQSLIGIRAAHSALSAGSYAELWRKNGGSSNLLGFFRGDGSDRVIVAINVGDAATVALPIASSHNLSDSDKAALPNGAQLTELLAAGAPATATVSGGTLSLSMPARTIGIYAP